MTYKIEQSKSNREAMLVLFDDGKKIVVTKPAWRLMKKDEEKSSIDTIVTSIKALLDNAGISFSTITRLRGSLRVNPFWYYSKVKELGD